MSIGELSQEDYGSLIGTLNQLAVINPKAAAAAAQTMGIKPTGPIPQAAPKPVAPTQAYRPSPGPAPLANVVTPKGMKKEDAAFMTRDWFIQDAAIQRKLTYKYWKSGFSNRDADIFTAAGATQFITLNPNAAKQAATGLNAVSTAAVTTNINLESDLQNLRKFLYFEGFSWNLRWRNGTGAGLSLPPDLIEEFLAQGSFQFYNDGSQLEDKILLSEIETPMARRTWAATYPAAADTNNAVQRGNIESGGYYRFPRYMVIHPRAPFGLLLVGVPAAMVAAVNATFPDATATPPEAGSDSNFEIEVILHEATQKLPS